MEQAMIAALLEKYWQAETTVEEEKLLAEYFRQPVISPEWEEWRNIFAYFEKEAQVTPGNDFDTRLLARIRQMETSPKAGAAHLQFRRAPWWAAAAVILLALGISRLAPFRGETPPVNGSILRMATANDQRNEIIKDTYDDPQQALAAIRRALGTASAKMNQGRKITQRQMVRMNAGLQTAIAN